MKLIDNLPHKGVYLLSPYAKRAALQTGISRFGLIFALISACDAAIRTSFARSLQAAFQNRHQSGRRV
jgi:hypothetical protein